MPLSIRSRLLLLLLSVLLPGMLGAAWLIASTFESERATRVRTLRQTSQALSMLVDNEIAQRSTIAHLLAASRWLESPEAMSALQLMRFREQAQSAMDGVGGWVELRDGRSVLVDTRGAATPAGQRPPTAEALISQRSLRVAQSSPEARGAHATLVEPVIRDGRLAYNIAVSLRTADLQRLVEAQPAPPGGITAIVDSRGALLARQPKGNSYIGRKVSAQQTAFTVGRSEGPFEVNSLDGERVTGYFHTGAMGLQFFSAMPSAALTGPWPSAVLRIAIAAGVLLLLALTGGLWLASRITRPLAALKADARRLQTGQPVVFASTGIVECDEVAAAMVQASSAICHARHELETQVVAAVARTRSAEKVDAHSQRVEALGRLTGGVAHDFNNLLGIISNSLHLVERHPAAAELSVPTEAALRAVEVGSQLTQHLLRFAGRRPTHPQRVHPALVLPEMRELLRSVLGGRITISMQVAPDTRPVTLDPGELELAVINLALNARDAMPAGGELWLRARNAMPDEAAGLAPAPQGHVLISVDDDGAGIAADQLAHVFEPFFTTKAVGKGTGLGLSQVLGFCLQAGGTARVDSTLGIGTTVSMLLPAAAPVTTTTVGPAAVSEAGRAQKLPSTSPATSLAADGPVAGARVLLVEDNDSLGAMTAALLRSHGAEVERATDAQSALLALARDPAFDVVLSDVVMPGSTDGLGLARQLREQRPDLPVLLISGYNDAAQVGSQEFVLLRKPCPPLEMLAALGAAIGPRKSRAAAPLI